MKTIAFTLLLLGGFGAASTACPTTIKCVQHGLDAYYEGMRAGVGGNYGVYRCTGNGQPHELTQKCN